MPWIGLAECGSDAEECWLLLRTVYLCATPCVGVRAEYSNEFVNSQSKTDEAEEKLDQVRSQMLGNVILIIIWNHQWNLKNFLK